MSNFKEASRVKLRIQTPVGNLSVEQLWDLDLETLDAVAVGLDAAYDESGSKSFLKTRSVKNKKIKLALDVVVDVLSTKVEEQEKALEAADVKAHNQKILSKIAEAKDKELDNKSPEELAAMLK